MQEKKNTSKRIDESTSKQIEENISTSKKRSKILNKQICKNISKKSICIAIATTFIMTFFMVVGCLYSNVSKYYEGFYGPFHAEVVLKDKDLYKNIKNNILVRDTAYISVKRYLLCNDKSVTYARSNTGGVGVGSLDKDVLKLFKIELSSGRLPKNNKEIILSDYYDIGEGSIAVGDEIELKLDAKSDADVYKVVGTYKDYIRMHQYNENEHLNEQINALTYDNKAKITDGSVVYVRYFNFINMNPYRMLRKIGIKSDDIYTNSELISLVNINDLWEYNIDGPIIIISQLVILLVLVIAAYILLYKTFGKMLRKSIDDKSLDNIKSYNKKENDSDKVKSKIDKKNISDKFKAYIDNKKILEGVVIGTIVAMINTLVICFFSKELMYKLFYMNLRLRFRICVVALMLGLVTTFLIIALAKSICVKQMVQKVLIPKEKLIRKNKKVAVIINCVVIMLSFVAMFLLDNKFKEPVKSYEEFIKDDGNTYDIRVFDEIYLETDDELIDEYREENETSKKEILKNYKRVKKELSDMPIDDITTMAVRTKEVIVDEYNKELKKAYVDAWNGYESVTDVAKLKEIYLDEKHYIALIKENNLQEDKYIGVDNPPAILFNIRRIYEDSYSYKEGRILNESTKELKTTEGKIKIGDFINTYVENVEPEEGFLEDLNVICICYPESCMKEINSFTIDIKVKDYEKIHSQFNDWENKNAASDMGIYTPTANLIEEKEIYVDKMKIVYLICGVIIIVGGLNIARIKLKNTKKIK